MAGHSKFANIKHRKGKQDQQRAKNFTRIGREITIAVKEGGADPDFNPRLRLALDNARTFNLPNDNIKRAIDRGAGRTGDADFEEFLYEGYGPGGVAILLEMATDNRVRSASNIRHIFSKYGGSLGQDGCVAWMFNRKGVLVINRTEESDFEEVFMAALEAGAEDIEEVDDIYIVYSEPGNLYSVRDKLAEQNFEIESAEIEFVADNTVPMPEEHKENVEILIEMLEENEDVQNVYTNLE